MTNYDKIKELIFKFSNLGLEISKETGAIKIGKAPYIAPLAIINCLYNVITEKDVKYIENEIKHTIPLSYKRFLTQFSNGLSVMGDGICGMNLYGLRHNYIRTIEMAWQPFSLLDYNSYWSDKPKGLPTDALVIGGYSWDGSKLYMTQDEKVHYCARYDSTSLKVWDSLEEMLLEEIPRLYSLVDENSVPKDPSKPTIPVIV